MAVTWQRLPYSDKYTCGTLHKYETKDWTLFPGKSLGIHYYIPKTLANSQTFSHGSVWTYLIEFNKEQAGCFEKHKTLRWTESEKLARFAW